MATIDDKVVSMSFESSRFESGVNTVIRALDKLKASLSFPQAGKGLTDINAAAKRVDLSHIGKAVDDVKNRLGALRLAAVAVFAQIASKAIAAGTQFAKAFTLDPIKAGFSEYTTNLNAVQTILANTQAAGVKLKDVNETLAELNEYSDKTIYNFSQMARNIGTFTAAGVDLDTATGAIKGIANLAALSGSNAEQASTAMYQLSQAISAGRVSLMDWNSVVNAGMGGTVFQRALAQTAEAMGTLKEGTVKLTGPMKNVSIAGESFRQSLSAGPGKESWLTSKVLTSTLKQFTGDLSDAALKAQGFNDAQIKSIQATAKTAQKAATEVKTISQVFEVAKETAGSGWAKTFQIIFGNFTEAKKTFTALSNTINDFINTNADARNKILSDWKALGGRKVLIDSIRIAFHNLGMILKPIKEAFRDIFPATTGKDLYNLTLRFQDFAKALKPSQETIDNLKRTFRGLFALLDIGKQIIGGVFTVLGKLFGVVGSGGGGFLNLTGNIGDFLVSVDEALKKGDRLHNFFEKLGDILATPIKLIGRLKDALAELFGGISPGGISGGNAFQGFLEGLGDAANRVLDQLGELKDILQPVFDAYMEFVKGIGTAIGEAASNMNFDNILEVIKTGLFAGLVVMFKQFLGRGSLVAQLTGAGGGIFANISGSFGALRSSLQGLTGVMGAMQQNLKAKTLKEIAIAIGILAISVLALSMVNPDKLGSAMTAIGVAMGQLLASMAILDKISSSTGFIKIPFIAGSMILLAGAIDVLSIAVIALSFLSWEELAKGLGAVAVLLGALSAASIPLSANSAGLVRAGIGITAMAIALRILASAVGAFGDMSWTELGKGLIAIAIGLGIMAGAVRAIPAGSIAIGVGLIAIAFGLKLLAGVVEKFGGMDLKTIGKGMLGIAGGLIIIAGAMRLMPGNMILTAAGLLIVSFALGRIVDAVESMGGMSVREIAKGLITLALSLGILAAALYVMSGTLAGAAALTIAAAGIALLVPALKALGGMSWGQILKSMVALGAALTVLGIAGALITPVIPSLIGLGVALVLIGGGLALAGAGIFLLAAGLSALIVAAPTGVGILIAAFIELEEAIPRIVTGLIQGLLAVVEELARVAPKFVNALVKIIDSLLDAIIKSAPKIAEAFNAIIAAALVVIYANKDKLIKAGFDLIISLLQGIKQNIGQITTLVIDIIAKFLNAVAGSIGKIVSKGVDVFLAFLRGIGQQAGKIVTTAASIITKFLNAIANALPRIVTAGTNIIVRLINGISNNVGRVVAAGTNAIVKFIEGIGNAGPRIVRAATQAITKLINQLAKSSVKLIDVGLDAIVFFMNGIANGINSHTGEMRSAGLNIAFAIADGMTFGLASKGRALVSQAVGIGHSIIGGLKSAVGAKSPSTEAFDVGTMVIAGLSNGLSDNASAMSTAEDLGNGIINMFKSVFQITSPSKVMQEIGSQVRLGFLQGLAPPADNDPFGIQTAFSNLNSKLVESMKGTRDLIKEEQAKLKELREADKPDQKAIAEVQRSIEKNQEILKRITAGHVALTSTLKAQKIELLGLARDYQTVTDKLDAANDALKEAIKTRDDAVSGFTDQYSTLPDIVKEGAEGKSVDQLAEYIKALKFQSDAVAAYSSTLDQLRALGLDDATYQKLLREGTADQQFADALLKGGKTAVESLNTLDKQLGENSKKLATNAGKSLYQAGVDTAQGLVNGLKSKKDELATAMEELADTMIKALKRKLRIKSPSEVFAEVGKFAMEGMAKGFADSSKVVTDAVEEAAQDALTAMQQTMRDISTTIDEELNPNPVITPILDLAQIRSQAQELSALTTTPVVAVSSFRQASTISSEQVRAQSEQEIVAPGGTSVKFEQNNYSPESLSEIDIYRQTRNQLSQLKSVLAF